MSIIILVIRVPHHDGTARTCTATTINAVGANDSISVRRNQRQSEQHD